jgi:hypothetical protein
MSVNTFYWLFLKEEKNQKKKFITPPKGGLYKVN